MPFCICQLSGRRLAFLGNAQLKHVDYTILALHLIMEAAVALVVVSVAGYRIVSLNICPSAAKAGGVVGRMSIIKLTCMEKPKSAARGEDHHPAVTDLISIIFEPI